MNELSTPMQRRAFLGLSAAGAVGIGATLLGAGQAHAASRPLLSSPSTTYAVGVREYHWTRGSRQLDVFVYYPATGTPGGSPVSGAPVAHGAFPVCNFTHGYSASPQKSLAVIAPLAAAGFIVPAPYFRYSGLGQVTGGDASKDVSEIITRTLALNTAADPLAGHIDARPGVGVSGHSMGGMTTLGLLTRWPDSRITTAIPMSTEDMGTPAGTVHAKVLFMHGAKDTTIPISSAQKAYAKMPAPKAFLTFRNASHASYFGDSRTRMTFIDWMRWGLYADTAARGRLAADAQSSSTTWQFVQ